MSEPIYGTFHDANTGQTVTRELTPEEVSALPTAAEQIPAPE